MSDPVAILSGELDRVTRDEPVTPDAPPRSLDEEEVPHDAGIAEQDDKKQGMWPSSNRTQVERDAEHTALLVDGTGDKPPVTPDDMEPAPPEGSLYVDVAEQLNRITDDLDGISALKDSFARLIEAAKKVSEPETIHSETALMKTAKLNARTRVARIMKKADNCLPTGVKHFDDIREANEPSKAWDDKGWWYERNFKVASDQREAFKTALYLEVAGNGKFNHQFVANDVPEGVKISVDRTPTGMNPRFTKDVDRIYDAQFLSGHKKAAGTIKAIIIRKTMIPREDHVCPHCEQAIGEKESSWPEEHRDHPDLISQHGPCGGLYSEERMPEANLQALMASLGADEHARPLNSDGDPLNVGNPGEWHDHTKLADVNLDIDIGDTLLFGRYKNSPHVVEEIGTDDKGQPTINGMKLLACRIEKKMPGQSKKAYHEGGSFTHEGSHYDLDSALAAADKQPTKDTQVSDLDWVLDHDAPDPARVSASDTSAPLLIARTADGAPAVVDGLHRLAKAKQEGRSHVPVREVTLTDQMKTAADKPFRRRVEVIITDGLNVWGEKKTPEKGGVWFPGGGVDSRNEKFADAAAREVIEESGFKVKEIYRLANVPPCACEWDEAIIEDSEKWAEKGKSWKGDKSYMYVATVESQGEPTSTEGDVMPGEWMTFASAIRKLRNAVPHHNQGWQKLTRTRLRSIMQLAPAGLKVPRRGEVEDFVEDVTDEVA